MSCFYILEINSLVVASFGNIFSHSVGCLFVLFMVSFAVQKLLSSIRSHLFIFVFIFITLGGGSKKILLWASLVAQWLRICLPMQGTRVRALVWEDPTCHGATKPVSHNC